MKTIEIHGIALDLPEGHWFFQTRRLPGYSENIGRLAAVVETKYPGFGFIDVGANVGDTAAMVCAHSQLPVLCIEGTQYREILEANIRRMRPDVELESVPDNGSEPSITLNAILARHASFEASKILKIAGNGMYGCILENAFDWIVAAQPILYWKHCLGHDASVGAQRSAIFDRLLAVGYRTALVFDNTGEFVQTVSLDAYQQLAEISDYFTGKQHSYGHGDICAFHEGDLDLCERFRQVGIENGRLRGRTALSTPSDEVQDAELAGVRAHTEHERHRLHRRIAELETHIISKDAEIDRLQGVLRDLLRSEELKAQLIDLRRELDTSLALRAARSLHWILGPIRRRMGGTSNGDRP